MSPPWWAAFGPAEVSVACGEDQHVIRWADGRLLASAHQDAEGELVLAALGGDTSGCLKLIQAWGDHSDDPEVLSLGPRSAADEVTASMADADELTSWPGGPGWASYGPAAGRRGPRRLFLFAARRAHRMGSAAGGSFAATGPRIPARRAHRMMMSAGGIGPAGLVRGRGAAPDRFLIRQAELTTLLALGTSLQLRLSAAVAAAWSAGRAGHDRAAAGPALTAALTGRLAPVAGTWLGMNPDLVEAAVHEGEGWGELAVAGAGDQRRLTAALPVSWLAGVWAPGLALVGGHLVVALQEAAWPRARVLALAEPGADPVVLNVRSDSGHWSVTTS